MKYLLFVWLMGADGMVESGWLPMATEQACAINASHRLQNLHMSDGSKAQGWVVECVEVGSQ